MKQANVEGESIKKDKLLQAKEKFIELKAEHETVILSRDKKIAEAEKRTRDKESQVSNELARNKKLSQDLEDKVKDYDFKLEFLEKKKEEVEKAHKSQVKQLEVISGLSAEEAKAQWTGQFNPIPLAVEDFANLYRAVFALPEPA